MASYFKKAKSLYASTANTFGTGTSVTITPASVSGLPTDTEITLTFDRVDSSGTATPNAMERIIGTISGGNFVVRTSPSSGRGADGTSDAAHTAPVVEYIYNAKDMNDEVDGILIEHNQDGTHKETALDSMIAGTEAQGDIIYHNGTIWTRLPKSTDGKVLTLASSVPSWATPSTATSVTDQDDAGTSATSSSTFANITGADVSVTPTVTSNILLIGSVIAYGNIDLAPYTIQWHDGTTVIGTSMRVYLRSSNPRTLVTVSTIVTNKAAGTYTYTLQHKSEDNSSSLTAEQINCLAIAIPA